MSTTCAYANMVVDYAVHERGVGQPSAYSCDGAANQVPIAAAIQCAVSVRQRAMGVMTGRSAWCTLSGQNGTLVLSADLYVAAIEVAVDGDLAGGLRLM